MPSQTELVGLGVPARQAAVLGNEPSALTAAGNAQTNAATIKSTLVTLTGSGADGAILPSTALIGTPYFVRVITNTALVYAPSGHTLNGSLNGSLSMSANKVAMFIQFTKGVWGSILTA